MRVARIVLAVLASMAPAIGAQQLSSDPCANQARAAFDVTTVKPSSEPAGNSSVHARVDGTTFTMTLRRLIARAYGLRDFQLTGGPSWINDTSWEVQGKLDVPEPRVTDDAGLKVQNERQMQRLQAVLADRFQLKCHITTRELPVYKLVVAKTGVKFTETPEPGRNRHSSDTNDNGHRVDYRATGIKMGDLARSFSSAVGRFVIDKTGLTGSYNVHVVYGSERSSPEDNETTTFATIFTAVEEQLGLKLVPAKGPVPVLVIDAVERPSEN